MRARVTSALVALAGIGIAVWTIGPAGFRQIAMTIAQVGIAGFLLFMVSYLVMLVALGAAWRSAMATRPRRSLALFTWARAVREAANDLLPFSQIGGLYVGIRVLLDAGALPTAVYAATIVDLGTELAAQLLLVLLGLSTIALLLAMPDQGTSLHAMLSIGMTALIALTAAFVLLQRPALALVSRLAERLVPAATEAIDAVRGELAAFARRPAALVPPLLWNAAAWLLAILSAWIGLRVLGADLSPARVLALEVLIYTIRTGAFFVPGAVGVQEAGYALLAPLFGLDRDIALALSLLKRARDVSVGAPTLLLWRFSVMAGRWRVRE